MEKLEGIYLKIDKFFEDDDVIRFIREGTMRAFESLLEMVGKETIYSFGIFTSGSYSYFTITANTEEALKKLAIRYSQLPSYTSKSLSDLEIGLRWSPCDWDYHGVINLIEFEKIESILAELVGFSDDILAFFDDFDKGLEQVKLKIYDKIDDLFIIALKETIIYFNPKSENIIMSVWMGDQGDDERERYITEINSKRIAERYIREVKIGYERL